MDSKTKPIDQGLFFPGAAESQTFWQSACRQGEDWLREQPRTIERFQAAADRWMRHRRDDFDRAVAAAQEMAACRDFAQAASIQQKWFAECTQNLISDWMALIAPAAEASRPSKSAGKND